MAKYKLTWKEIKTQVLEAKSEEEAIDIWCNDDREMQVFDDVTTEIENNFPEVEEIEEDPHAKLVEIRNGKVIL